MDLDWESFSKDYEWLIVYLKGMVKPAAALAVVLLAVALSYSQNLSLEGEMIYSVFRSFLQLSVIGFVLQFIFNQENSGWIVLAYLFMVKLTSNRFFFDSRKLHVIYSVFLCSLGLCRRLHRRTTCEARATWKVRGRSIYPYRNCNHNVPAHCPQRLSFHSEVYNSSCRNDGRKRHDGHRSYHETATRWHQDATKPGKSPNQKLTEPNFLV